jgi:predicted permease
VNFGQVRSGVRRHFRLALHDTRRAPDDAREELLFFIDARVEQLVAVGYTPAAARAEALRRLGGTFDEVLAASMLSAYRRERDMSIRELFTDFRDDLRFAWRGVRREKLVAIFIVLTLALGIGANAAMFGVIDRLLIRGPEYIVRPAEIARVFRTEHSDVRGDLTSSAHGWVMYDILRRDTRLFRGAAGYAIDRIGIPFGKGSDATLVPFASVNADLFPLLGVQPELGRFFNSTEDSPTAPQAVVVLGHGLWQRAFGGARDVLGRKARFGDVDYTIIGVAPRGFTGPELGPVDAWMPLALRSQGVTDHWTTSWNAQWLRLVVRLAPGVTPAQANDGATAAMRAAYTGDDPMMATASISTGALSTNNRGKESVETTISRWLVGVAAIVLLIACANVANLLLARAVRRRREVAVRVALGAGRGRLVRLLLAESMLLAAAGGAAGLAVAWATGLFMRRTLLPGLEWPSAPVDERVLGVALFIAIAVGLLTGLVPALRASRPDLTAALKAGAREGGGRASRLRGALTVAQAALSLVLLVGAGLFVRSLLRVRAIDLGLQPDRVMVVQLRYPTGARVGDPSAAGEVARRAAVLRELMARSRTVPSVEAASLTIGLSFQSSFGLDLRVPGWDSIPTLEGGGANISAVADDYFATVGTRILAGRAFTPEDRQGSEPVAIVSQTMATTLWRGKSPIGDCLYWGESRKELNVCSRIVGIAADAHSFELREGASMHYYIPLGQERGIGGTSLLVRPRLGEEEETIAALRALILDADPSISFVNMRMLQEEVDPQVRPWRLGATIFVLMGILAAIVAAAGLYSVMSYFVAQRTQEIGVRIALGARPARIVGLIVRGSVSMALAGVAVGIVVVLAAGRFVEPLLFETSPRDPLVLGGVAAMLIGVALLASAVPAMRAKRVNPIDALRAE